MSIDKFTLLEHLKEARSRIIKSFIFFSVISCLFYVFVPLILSELIKPVGEVIFTAPTDAFTVYFAITLWGGLFLSSPFIFYQIWQFIFSGLRKREKRLILIFWLWSVLLFIAGCLFAYFSILPIGLRFFLKFATPTIRPMIALDKYISFAAGLILTFGLVFQTPLIVIFLTKIGLITPQTLCKRRREAIVLIFIIAAVLTPPDVVSQVLLALPLLVLYEAGIICAKLVFRGNVTGQ